MINTIIAVILLVWFIAWARKTYGTTTAKEYFNKLLNSSELGFAKLDFELYGLGEEREELRKEFDRQNEYLNAFEAQVENNANNAETKEKFKAKITETKELIEKLKDSINTKDIAIKTAQETKDDLHSQMRNLVTYMKREF